MMRPHKVIVVPNPILRVQSRPVHHFGRTLTTLIKEMLRVMDACNSVGLAAVQIGIPSEVLVVNHPQWRGVMVNPFPKKWVGTQYDDEGCLSIPYYLGEQIARAQLLVVGYEDERGHEQELVSFGSLAHILQHEMDHLDGKLITDYFPKRKIA